MYKIDQFIISKVGECNAAVQNSKGINFLRDSKLIKFLEWVDENNLRIFSYDLLNDFFVEEIDKYIDFLIDSEIMREYDVINYKSISKIGIYSNCKIFNDYFNYISSEMFEVFNDVNSVEKYDVIVLFFDIFILHSYNNLIDKFREFDIPIISCFCYNNKFYISNLHKSSWYNPCPKCFFSNLETSLRAYGNMQNSPSFQTVVDLIYSYDCNFKIQNILNNTVLTHLVSEILKFINTDVNILANRIVEIDFDGNISYDVPTHWEICDCFE